MPAPAVNVEALTTIAAMSVLTAPDAQGLPLVDIIDFKWLMAGAGLDVHVERMQADRAYACACLARGASNKQIARDLGITDTTVKVHLRMIFKKLGVSNRTQAAFFARERLPAVA